MTTIELQGVRLTGIHGVYELERKTGNEYEITVKVSYEEGLNTFDTLDGTINYVALFDIVKRVMQVRVALLEKVADSIARAIKTEYNFIREINISIYKLGVPIENFQGRVGVTLHKRFDA